MMQLMFTLSARRVFKLSFFHDEESYITNPLMTDPSGNKEFVSLEFRCFPKRSRGKHRDSQTYESPYFATKSATK